MEQQMIYLNKSYKILNEEQEFIIHPMALGLLPVTKASLQRSFCSDFHVEDYRLIFDHMEVEDDKNNEKITFGAGFPVSYNGAVLLGSNLVKEYYLKGKTLACFSYQNVLELVFENGMLITTVDQSKAMLRIRKNIELGLRNLNNKRDLRCIKRFLNASFVGEYKPFLLDQLRIRYLKDMKSEYDKININKA